MSKIQFILVLCAISGVCASVLRGVRKRYSLFEHVVWVVFWLLVAVVAYQPEITSHIAEFVGVGRGADVVLYAGMILIFFMLFRIIARIEQIESSITKIVQHIALHEVKKGNDKSL